MQEIIEGQREQSGAEGSIWEGSQYSFGPQTGRSQLKHSGRSGYNRSPRGAGTLSKENRTIKTYVKRIE